MLTAEPLDLITSTRSSGGYTRNMTRPLPSGPKCSERSGIKTSSRSSRRRWYCTGSTITTAAAVPASPGSGAWPVSLAEPFVQGGSQGTLGSQVIL